MSGIAGIYNVPASPEEFMEWLFVHAAHHQDIVSQIYNDFNFVMPQYLLDPFDPSDKASTRIWAYQHQTMHSIQNGILGINGFDLLDVNWQDKDEVEAWIELNADEHLQASNVLGIG